jgi:hypothetical protein
MSTPTSRKSSNSLSSWGLKRCLKVAAGFVLLSQASIAHACSPATVSVTYEETYNELCIRKACSVDHRMIGFISLTISGGYSKTFEYTTQNGQAHYSDVKKRCSSDGVFCVDFRGSADATLYYANDSFNLGSPSGTTGTRTNGHSYYYICL